GGGWKGMVVNVDGTGERLVVQGGYHPTWADRGAAVLFERGLQLWRIDLASGEQRLVLDGPREFPGVSEIGDFEMSHDGRQLAFGLRGRVGGAVRRPGEIPGAETLRPES